MVHYMDASDVLHVQCKEMCFQCQSVGVVTQHWMLCTVKK